MRVPRRALLLASGLLVLGTAAAAAATTPLFANTVSPGSLDDFEAIVSRCPTFSWTAADRRSATELAIFDLGTNAAALAAVDPAAELAAEAVIHRILPRGATSWTPSLDRCLTPGHVYVWFVRSASPDTSGATELTETVAAWSPGRLLAVDASSSARLERALELIDLHLAGQVAPEHDDDRQVTTLEGAADPPPDTERAPVHSASTDGRSRLPARAASLEGSAALTGEQTDTTGTGVGVRGIAHSPQGAGVEAANLAGGADLVLDGSADGETSAYLTQSGLDRPSDLNETFEFRNSGGGSMTLLVEGRTVGTITEVIAGEGLVGGGSTGDVELRIANGGVKAYHLADGSVNGDKVLDGSLTGQDVEDDSLTGNAIADGTIQSWDLGSFSVDSGKLAAGAVTNRTIVDGAVSRDKLAEIRVVAVECKGECSDGNLTQVCATAGAGFQPLFVDSHRSFSASALFLCGGDNECANSFVLRGGTPLSSVCADGSGWDCRVYCMRP